MKNYTIVMLLIVLGLIIGNNTVLAQCYRVVTISGNDEGCSPCTQTGSPIPYIATCGGISYHIDTHVVCAPGSDIDFCWNNRAIVGKKWDCIVTPNQPAIDACASGSEPGCVLACLGCFSTGNPLACAACALCIIRLDNSCTGCAIVICARSANYTPIYGVNAFTQGANPCVNS